MYTNLETVFPCPWHVSQSVSSVISLQMKQLLPIQLKLFQYFLRWPLASLSILRCFPVLHTMKSL